MTGHGRLQGVVIFALGVLLAAPASPAAEVETVRIAYLSQIVELPPKLSNLDLPSEDEGFQGGRLAIKDNNTTGRFMKQAFELHETTTPRSRRTTSTT